MRHSLFTKTIRDNRRAIIGWSAGAALLTLWLSALFPFIQDSEAMTDFLDEMPKGMMEAFGMDPDTYFTGAGYLSAQLYAFMGPILIIGFAVGLGVALSAKEEHEGTMDMLLSAPLSRARVFTEKIGASALLTAAVPASMGVVLIAANKPLGLEISINGILSANVGLWFLGLVFGAVAILVGTFTGNPALARGIAFFAGVLAWFTGMFDDLFTWLEIPGKLSPFSWYIDGDPMLDPWPRGFVWLTITIAVVGSVSAWLFSRRDIGTELAVLPKLSLLRRLPKVGRRTQHRKPRSAWLLRSVRSKTVWDRRISVFVWASGIASLLLFTFAAWPAMSGNADALENLINAMPTEMFAVFGMTDPESLATAAGFISSRAYLNMGPLLMILFCVGGMSAYVAKEERTGLLDMVLANALPRRSVLTQKIVALAGLATMIAILLIAFGLVGNALWDTELEAVNIVGANIGLLGLGLFFAGMALALWSLLGSGGTAVGITTAFAVISYFLNGLATVVDPIEFLRPISPFYWYIGDTVPLAKGIIPAYGLLFVGAAIGAAVAVWRFERRDLAV